MMGSGGWASARTASGARGRGSTEGLFLGLFLLDQGAGLHMGPNDATIYGGIVALAARIVALVAIEAEVRVLNVLQLWGAIALRLQVERGVEARDADLRIRVWKGKQTSTRVVGLYVQDLHLGGRNVASVLRQKP